MYEEYYRHILCIVNYCSISQNLFFTKIAVHKLKYYGMWEQHMMTVNNCHEMWAP